LSFPETIQNQLTISLSTFAGAVANKNAILAFQKQFYNDTQKLIKDDDIEGFVIQGTNDPSRFERMLSILDAHDITYKVVSEDRKVAELNLQANNAIYVPIAQGQYRLIRSLFSERQRFADNTFYDVSNWNLPLAFNFSYASVNRSQARKIETTDSYRSVAASTTLNPNAYAYAFDWHDSDAPALLQFLLSEDVQVRVAGGDFTAQVEGANGPLSRNFDKGTIMIPSALEQPTKLRELLSNKAKELNLNLYNIVSGLTSKGIDLGSRTFAPVTSPKVLLIGGKGTSQYEVGEIWHYLDTRVGVPATLLDLSDLNGRDVSAYTHIIFASGSYSSVDEETAEALKTWVQKGGVMIGQKSALRFFSQQKWIDNKIVSRGDINDAFSTKDLGFGDKRALAAKKLIAGSVYKANVDLSHPLMFGFESTTLPLFKTSNMIMKQSDNVFNEVATYTDKPLVAGYTADELQSMISETSAIVVKPIGRGVVIGFVDNIHFRGYWDGTNKLMSNSLFMSPLIN
jgi:hypothetical protein